MITIWKYELEVTDLQMISVPEGAKPLSVQEQGRKLCLWMIVNPYAVIRDDQYRVRIIGTGNPVEIEPEEGSYVGTVQFGNHGLVRHVFVETEQ